MVSETGSAWYLSAEVTSKDFLELEEWKLCREVLFDGGLIVSCTDSADSLVLVAQSGGLVRLPMEKLRPWKGEKRLVQVVGTSLVSACCCTERDDLLLISEQGKVLRIHAAGLRKRLGLGGSMIKGMELGAG